MVYPLYHSSKVGGLIKQELSRAPGASGFKILRDQMRLRYGRRARGLREYAPPPRILMLESSGLCNFQCGKCAHKQSTRKLGLMDVELAFSAVDQAARMGIELLCASMLGEPLMHPEVERIIERGCQRGLAPYMVTNGMLLTPERARDLVRAGVKEIIVSIDGWDEESYAARQAGGDLAAVLSNMDAVREMRHVLPVVSTVTLLDTQTRKHLPEIKNLLAPHADKLRLAPLKDFGIPGHVPDPGLLVGTRSWKRAPCDNLWNTLNVGWDGAITACCNDHNYLLEFEHLGKAPLEEIWNAEKIRFFRRLHLAGEFDKMPMCGRCTCDWGNSFVFHWLKNGFIK